MTTEDESNLPQSTHGETAQPGAAGKSQKAKKSRSQKAESPTGGQEAEKSKSQNGGKFDRAAAPEGGQEDSALHVRGGEDPDECRGSEEIDPEMVERALEAFQRGSPAEFDRLVSEDDGEESGVCAAFADILNLPAAGTDLPERIGE